jgi:hypothetical protein
MSIAEVVRTAGGQILESGPPALFESDLLPRFGEHEIGREPPALRSPFTLVINQRFSLSRGQNAFIQPGAVS